ncbi:TfoX/Sxy family protein [Paraflavisolibacter sp. H34]|uniref:TfoX/Sxy family protein n=1 Tax=Huijunlia imazamoxiresistens TaxID=3127457 RepID=UPI0030195BAA
MAYDTQLADRIREYLAAFSGLKIDEKEMFRGITFMVNGKMCVCVSGSNLMCRFDPAVQEAVAEQNGYLPMVMKGKELSGYCYVHPSGFASRKDFEYWVNLCLDYNDRAKPSRKAGKEMPRRHTRKP